LRNGVTRDGPWEFGKARKSDRKSKYRQPRELFGIQSGMTVGEKRPSPEGPFPTIGEELIYICCDMAE